MPRNLQINLFEAPLDSRRGRRGFGRPDDPGENIVVAPPDDPGENVVAAPPDDTSVGLYGRSRLPDDPGENVVAAPPDDTSGGAGGAWRARGAPAPYGSTVTVRTLPPFPGTVLGGCGCASKCDCDETPAERPCIAPGDYSGFLIVRLARGVGPLDVDSLWELAEASRLEGLKKVLERPLDGQDEDHGEPAQRLPSPGAEDGSPEPQGALVSRPLIQVGGCGSRAELIEDLRGLSEQASRTAFPPRCGLERYWRVDLRDAPDLVAEVLDAFDALAEVDLVYRELTARDTANGGTQRLGEVLLDDQGYFEPAPVGIGVRRVRKLLDEMEGTSGPSVQVVDLEQGWLQQHQELAGLDLSPVHGHNRDRDDSGSGHHGAAVLGQLAAAGEGDLGVVGSVHDLAEIRLTSHYRTRDGGPSPDNPFPGTNGHVASAIVACLVGSSPLLGVGDVLLLEIQRGRLPTETDAADFDAIRLAVALGVTVIEAAGNGGFDLDRCDDPRTGQTLRRGAAGFVDSGAVMVGAAWSELPHDRAPFSNYGSRIDCYAWGEGVTTCGYGDLHGEDDPDEYYTNTFDGTSSAAPIIAGAAALLQILHENTTGGTLSPLAMRALLSNRATGTPQGPNVGGQIGVMPDLERILRDVLGLVPALYLRRHPCDDGGVPGRDESISSCPDLVLVDGNGKKGTPTLDESSPGAHHPAPGQGSNTAGDLYVRARNRGLAAGSAEVLLFASPAATLITPDDWQPFGATTLDTVPPGDILHGCDVPLSWTPPGPGFHSLLAVLFPEGCAPPEASLCALPPRMPYFDWRRYLEFLRGPNVGWRNVHPISAGSGLDLDFFLTGTPDRGRRFDLEVVQRLPEGATVKLRLPEVLLASLGQRQPSIPREKGRLLLPRRRSVRFSHVRLPAGLRAPATFEVNGANGAKLEPGHSLAIRQLWQGVEVGRVTWVVT